MAEPPDAGTRKNGTEEKEGGESTLTVLVALGANAAIGVLKLIAGLLTGSAAMLAEAGHSVADTATEGLLLTALRRSTRAADRRHPFGYGKERFFWALIAAVSIFVSGAVFAIYEGIRTILGDEAEQTAVLVAYIVLAISFVLEGISWIQAVRQLRSEAAADDLSPLEWLRRTDDPTVKTVFFEDSAALTGLLLAFAGVGLHQLTGSAIYDGIASLLIGLLLTGVAYILGRTNKGLLIGRQADARTVVAIRDALGARPEVDAVVDLLTMMLGTDQILLCARLDFDDALGAADLERTCVEIDADLRERFPDLAEVFLEPVPRNDPTMRERVLSRYGGSTSLGKPTP
ncbi:MAG: cation transporter [Pseudonocardia sp.]|uniref:cation diffusion facilitator family transporter n=1 Tax=unclassified Pseudonocardia TaxID=2619320 RepID=UPI00086ADCDF|nr:MULTISPECIES: cation diffusion facilitator family transporter [unclassified Pseudonocardia]MBN9110242.1 cation transporter [Pseudonocardia sp.]ODU19989.1 MAG: cation diffusion facilitator family transporter [Pseudonocardia sp. SCN 72-51]ODV06374.1 MAG: cation diffusion facilitator family transporter [Pseudonocardia sp. SCN 73-27]